METVALIDLLVLLLLIIRNGRMSNRKQGLNADSAKCLKTLPKVQRILRLITVQFAIYLNSLNV